MPEPLDVAPGVRIPAAALEVRSVRASGPGGQNVNKVASKVELVFDPASIDGLDGGARSRLRAIAGRRLLPDGRVRVTSQESRDRSRNLETAREKAADLVRRALEVPVPRTPTRPGRGARQRRLDAKKRDASVKKARRTPARDD